MLGRTIFALATENVEVAVHFSTGRVAAVQAVAANASPRVRNRVELLNVGECRAPIIGRRPATKHQA